MGRSLSQGIGAVVVRWTAELVVLAIVAVAVIVVSMLGDDAPIDAPEPAEKKLDCDTAPEACESSDG